MNTSIIIACAIIGFMIWAVWIFLAIILQPEDEWGYGNITMVFIALVGFGASIGWFLS